MTRAAALAFFVVCGLMFTGVLEPLTHGRDDSWAIVVTPVAATIGLAYAVRGWRMLFAPLALGFAGVVAFGDDPIAMAGLAVIGVPALLSIAAVAVVLARRAEHAGRVVIVSFAVAALPLLWGTVDTVRRGAKLPGEVQARLPVDDSLGRYCDEALTARELRPKIGALLRELREEPQSLVRRTYYGADEPEEHAWITVRELAEEHLQDLERNDCAPPLQQRLRDAL